MLTFKKNTEGGARNKSGGKNKNRGAMLPMPPAGDAPDYVRFMYRSSELVARNFAKNQKTSKEDYV